MNPFFPTLIVQGMIAQNKTFFFSIAFCLIFSHSTSIVSFGSQRNDPFCHLQVSLQETRHVLCAVRIILRTVTSVLFIGRDEVLYLTVWSGRLPCGRPCGLNCYRHPTLAAFLILNGSVLRVREEAAGISSESPLFWSFCKFTLGTVCTTLGNNNFSIII